MVAAMGHSRWALVTALTMVLMLGACATPERPQTRGGAPAKNWHGRLGLRIESSPVQSLSATLDLSGDAQAGDLLLSGPLGTALLALSWRPGRATMQRNGQSREYNSVSALMQDALGADLPLAALFAWLAGEEAAVEGWQVDLAQLSKGRLSARRVGPAPAVDLRLMLEP